MFRNTSGLAGDGEAQYPSSEASLRWLRGTRQLDVMNTGLRARVKSLTQLLYTDREKAVAIHDYVKSLPFACVPDYASLMASDILKLGHGDCSSKGMLFVAMLRVAKIPARLHFVSLPTHFLRGIVPVEDATLMHAMAEVRIEGNWWVVDSYVTDEVLQVSARELLRHEDRKLGYGIHLDGAMYWDGQSHASAQCSPADPDSLPTVDWGLADDPQSFYADESHSQLRHNFVTRLKWRMAAPKVNKRVAAIRAGSNELLADSVR
jgi:hypothetical protein